MSRQNKAGAISIVLIALIVLSVCLVSIDTRVLAIARLQNLTVTPTPCDADPDDCADYATDDAMDAMTASADALTATAGATPGTLATTATTSSARPTLTPTLTPTGFAVATTLAPSPSQPTPSIEQQLAPTDTPTAIPANELICFPGQPLVLSGEGPARAPFLVYFGQRVVSGGSVSSNGRFAATLIIGPERAGVYTIAVRVRGTSKALLETTCAVPDVTPTLVPRARQLP